MEQPPHAAYKIESRGNAMTSKTFKKAQLVKAKRSGSEIVRVTTRSANWRYVGFAAYHLRPAKSMLSPQIPPTKRALSCSPDE